MVFHSIFQNEIYDDLISYRISGVRRRSKFSHCHNISCLYCLLYITHHSKLSKLNWGQGFLVAHEKFSLFLLLVFPRALRKIFKKIYRPWKNKKMCKAAWKSLSWPGRSRSYHSVNSSWKMYILYWLAVKWFLFGDSEAGAVKKRFDNLI